jgi:hypothetical protein
MSRSRERARFVELQAALAGVAFPDLAAGVDAWAAALLARPAAEATRLARTLLRAYRHGALTPARWEQLTGRPPVDDVEVDRAVARLWDVLAGAQVVPAYSEDAGDGSPAMLRRWAFQPRWCLLSQDEDLVLMDDAHIPVLLDLAADRRVPKRAYLLEIVAHHARDSCSHAALWGRELPGTLARVAAWAPHARRSGGADVAEYLERLGSYARPGPVDRAGALQRLIDLGRCAPPTRAAVRLTERDGAWEGTLVHSGGNRRLRIDAATGAITLVRPRT